MHIKYTEDDGVYMGKIKTVRVSEETHRYLINASNRMGVALKRKVSMDEAVKYSSLSLEFLVASVKGMSGLLKEKKEKERDEIFKKAVEVGKSIKIDIPENEKAELIKLITHLVIEALPSDIITSTEKGVGKS